MVAVSSWLPVQPDDTRADTGTRGGAIALCSLAHRSTLLSAILLQPSGSVSVLSPGMARYVCRLFALLGVLIC